MQASTPPHTKHKVNIIASRIANKLPGTQTTREIESVCFSITSHARG